MTQRQEIIERLRAVDLGGGSHESLSALAKAVYEPAGGWTIVACEALRQALVRLLEEAEDVDQGARIIASDEGWDEGYKVGYDAGFAIADDWCAQHEDAMAEHGWVRLPKDADGEYIHFGDVLDQFGTPMTVYAMSDPDPDQGDCMLELITDGISDSTWVRARKMRHHKQPTVEDVLTEFAAKLIERGELTNGAAQTIAEYAKRLKLAGDAE